MRVLGIETSCDETGLALYDGEKGLLGDVLYSQVAKHQAYGGVVPELASRDHVQKLLPLLEKLLEKTQLSLRDIDAIAYTAGPGLIGALLVGSTFARSLAYALTIPSIAIHHMEGHLLAPMLEEAVPAFPFLALLVSGGHTLLVRVNAMGDYQLLGQSLDDAVGEAFDKTAKLLGLPYPGGPELAKLAQRGQASEIVFPRPMTDKPGLDFSFSGLKTAVVHYWAKSKQDDKAKADIAYAFQQAVVETLTIKCQRALKQTGLNQLVVAGGVSANHCLREALTEVMKNLQGSVYFPRSEFCTDNGAMIAYAGFCRLSQGDQDTDWSIVARARWPLVDV